MDYIEIAAILLFLGICLLSILLVIRIVKGFRRSVRKHRQKRRQKRWERAQRKWNKRDAKAQRQLYREYTPPQKAAPKKTPDEIFAESPDWEWDEKSQMWRRKKSE